MQLKPVNLFSRTMDPNTRYDARKRPLGKWLRKSQFLGVIFTQNHQLLAASRDITAKLKRSNNFGNLVAERQNMSMYH